MGWSLSGGWSLNGVVIVRKPFVLMLIATVAAAMTSCGQSQPEPVQHPAHDWHPAPVTQDKLSVLAEQTGTGPDSGLVLHTAGGPIDFWGGVNLGTSIPGHNPGEVAMSPEQYQQWIQQMGDFGVRFLRVYTLHQPAFYQALRDYNLAHPDYPIYLLHGVYLPDESYLESHDLYDPKPTAAFTRELHDLSDAVSGDLERELDVGRAGGSYTADVSPWVAAWIIGVEWDPNAIHKSEKKNRSQPPYRGKYFTTSATKTQVNSTESWIAARMDELASAEVKRGRSVPIAFVNWPTADPLDHGSNEPNPTEDLVSVDANHVLPTKRWPGGTFASYHSYPYYPDFLRHTKQYTSYVPPGASQPDPWAGYLNDLRTHYARANIPLMVTEFGVPSSLGSAHLGTNGRDQGNHSELEAMAMNAAQLRVIKDVGLAGGLLFMWADEWFKFTWNTAVRQSVVDSERRSLWHDPLTNEQAFGIYAGDPVSTGWRVIHEAPENVREVAVDTDASYVYLRLTLNEPPESPVVLGFDVVPGGQPLPNDPQSPATHDIAIVLDPQYGTADAYITPALDPVTLDGLKPDDLLPPDLDGWNLQRLTLNRSVTVRNETFPAEFLDVGRLIRGTWDPQDDEYESLATWNTEDNVITLRVPWSMLAIADPSSKTGLVPKDGTPTGVRVETIALTVNTGSGAQPVGVIDWEPWQRPQYAYRLKKGARDFEQALADTTG